MPGAGETCPGRSYRVGGRMLLLFPNFPKLSDQTKSPNMITASIKEIRTAILMKFFNVQTKAKGKALTS